MSLVYVCAICTQMCKNLCKSIHSLFIKWLRSYQIFLAFPHFSAALFPLDNCGFFKVSTCTSHHRRHRVENSITLWRSFFNKHTDFRLRTTTGIPKRQQHWYQQHGLDVFVNLRRHAAWLCNINEKSDIIGSESIEVHRLCVSYFLVTGTGYVFSRPRPASSRCLPGRNMPHTFFSSAELVFDLRPSIVSKRANRMIFQPSIIS